MTLLYPSFLWLLLPLMLLLWRDKNSITSLVHLIVLMLLVLVLSRPVDEKVLQKANIEAKDIVIALDVSYSMRATDLSPSRYTFAKETIKALLVKNPSDNIMLIAFTTNPLLLSPPTTDHRLIAVALESLNPEYILTKGTSLKRLFKKLSTMQIENKNLILITDGGEESQIVKLQTLVEESQCLLTILALGSKQGTTIQNKDGSLLKDKQGNLVISRINPLLKRLSHRVQGSYLEASSTPEATASNLDKLLRDNATQKQMIQKIQRHYAERYQFPLFLALVLFFMLHTRAIKILVIFFTLFGFKVQASMLDDYHLNRAYSTYTHSDFTNTKAHLQKIDSPSLQSQMTLANTYYKERDFKKAIKIYKSIRSTSTQVKQNIYYNIANAYAMLEAYDKAKIYYTKTLQLGEDADAVHNLKRIALLHDKDTASLGIAHPKSQNSTSSKSEQQESKEEKTRNEDEPSSASGGGGESAEKEKKEQAKKDKLEKNKLIADDNEKQQPLGSKVYELINKGYIRESQPW